MNPDFLVIGAGVAGLSAAIELAEAGQVLVIAKDSLRESSSEYAQGGIAVALGEDDSVELHAQDTLFAGDGLCDAAAVRVLTGEGPAAVRRLIEWGAEFDRDDGRLCRTREGAHCRSRVLHAHGDSTGREIARALYVKAASLPNITFRTFAATTDLLLGDGVCGAVVCDAKQRTALPIRARAALLATGGLGRVFLNTTNPDVATGDGVAIAWRAGAEIADVEFVQFHPTALRLEGAPSFLLSEAMRGEGAILRNAAGEAFMERYHALKDLAPRDVVARAMVAEMRREGSACVYLDATHRGAEFLRGRFPRIYDTLLRRGIDIGRQPAPVAPAAHYAMGGVWTDLDGRTSLPGLYAAGEAACTGVHGANRLASNSLLEGLVFGARAGRAMRECGEKKCSAAPPPARRGPSGMAREETERAAWDLCGILRTPEGLAEAVALLGREGPPPGPLPEAFEARNMQQTAWLIARAALARRESRGAHFRADCPAREHAFEKHSITRNDADITFR
jgi:L-aspartate oxidase